ncbi:hypothetical protein EXIGLDRAFT_759421 [Exidia glandulosa HHB12029]|uniref:F-box domain-containing protein n=1 Tax=Exidia glandulosa HHB12029 TaxID=1314781 RepID=A0A165Q5L2_EXIGL|nr:hypothetical protein EXIGLDRAFT_759421 [Exidia glandulosa HHB12029]
MQISSDIRAVFSDDMTLRVQSGVHALPDELLCLVFFYAKFSDRLCCTRVCRHWRAASLAAPGQLWNKVKSRNQIRGAFSGLLDRSAGVPALVRVHVRNCNAPEVGAALTKHMGHIASLTLDIDEELDLETSALQLARALTLCAPIIRTLIIFDGYNAISVGLKIIGAPVFAYGAQYLTTFKLHGYIAEFMDAPALRAVRHLLYCPYTDGPGWITLILCSSFSGLETIGLEIGYWESRPMGASVPLPPNLRALVITSLDDDLEPQHVLASIPGHGGIQKLNFTFDADCPRHAVLPLFGLVTASVAEPFSSITIDSSANSSHDDALIDCTTASGRVREFHNIPPILPQDMFHGVRSLAVSEWEWNVIDPFPDAPVLESLTIRLVTPIYANNDRSVFLDVQRDHVLYCPSLHTLAISTRERGDPDLLGFWPALAPEMVSRFIERKLDMAGRTMVPLLLLNAVRLLQNVIDEVIELLALVDDIKVGPGHPSLDSKTTAASWDSDIRNLQHWE